ncbi:MAG: hypothetical protein M4579_005778 [Chaenotheca gracillima]|nr:MAG: hypothetical protein M4579_005778 [Chaenotheca gracillima]
MQSPVRTPASNPVLDESLTHRLSQPRSTESKDVESQKEVDTPQLHRTPTFSLPEYDVNGLRASKLSGSSSGHQHAAPNNYAHYHDLGIEVDPHQWHPNQGNPHGPFAVPKEGQGDGGYLAPEPDRRRHFFKRPIVWIFLGVLLIAIIIALAVPLALHFRNQDSSSPAQIAPEGAINGSGIVALDLADGSRRIALYSQHFNGEIRKYEYLDGTWTGGTGNDVVVESGAKDGTPLMGLSYAIQGELIWRVFFVDENNTLQERINSNLTASGWAHGSLGDGNFKVSESSHVGLTACRNYQWYGAPYNSSGFGIRLYYGGDDHAVRELQWSYGHQAWGAGAVFDDANGDGGMECTIDDTNENSVTNLWLLNKAGELEHRWYDFNETAKTPTHPSNTWVKGNSIAGPTKDSAIAAIRVLPGTQKLVHAQLDGGIVREYVAEGAAELSNFTTYQSISGSPAIVGGRLGSVVLTTNHGGQEIHVFYQTNGTDVTDFIRTLDGDTWSPNSVPTGPP